jgi:hypothetical protein
MENGGGNAVGLGFKALAPNHVSKNPARHPLNQGNVTHSWADEDDKSSFAWNIVANFENLKSFRHPNIASYIECEQVRTRRD